MLFLCIFIEADCRHLAFASVFGVISSFQMGYNLVVINAPNFNKDCDSQPNDGRCIIFPGHSKEDWSFMVAFLPFGALVGCILAPPLSDGFGRRWAQLVAAGLHIIGALLEVSRIFIFAVLFGYHHRVSLCTSVCVGF